MLEMKLLCRLLGVYKFDLLGTFLDSDIRSVSSFSSKLLIPSYSTSEPPYPKNNVLKILLALMYLTGGTG